jgi:hypothetical protein
MLTNISVLHAKNVNRGIVECYNCRNPHMVKDCTIPMCGKCGKCWKFISDPGYHSFGSCQHPNVKRVRFTPASYRGGGGRKPFGVQGRGRGVFSDGRRPFTTFHGRGYVVNAMRVSQDNFSDSFPASFSTNCTYSDVDNYKEDDVWED